MPRPSASARGAFSAFGAIRNFTSIIREMSFDHEREQAERLPRLLILAPDQSTGQNIGETVTGSANSAAITVWPLDQSSKNTDPYDVVIVFNPESNAAFVEARRKAGKQSGKVFDLSAISVGSENWAVALRERIACGLPELAPALGRWFPAFRPAATRAVINETARVNAQFALVSNIPAAIPIVGALAAVGADFFVLTKNQVMMVFKLAAIHGRDLNNHWAIIRELAPVVGVGFAWRTLAREAASFIPLMAGTVPKVAIAYTGTIAAGRAAEFYYRHGKKPTRDQLRGYYLQASDSLKHLSFQMPGRSKTTTPEIDFTD